MHIPQVGGRMTKEIVDAVVKIAFFAGACAVAYALA